LKKITSLLAVFLYLLLCNSFAQSVFQSVQSGNWDDASTWRSGAGAGGTAGIDYPLPTDEVYIALGDTVYIDFGTTGTLYEFEGYLEVAVGGTIWITVGDNESGLALINDARLFNRGNVYTGLSTQGPGTTNPYEIDIYIEDNAIYYAYTGSYNYVSDDVHIRNNGILYTEVDVCFEIDDDFHLNGTNSLICGDGGASIGFQSGTNEVIYEAGADSTNICEGLIIYRGLGATCDPVGGTQVVEGDGPTNLRPRAVKDDIEAAENTAHNVSVLYIGLDDIDLDGPTLEIIQAGSNGAINNNSSAAGGTLSINDNGTPGDFSDDYIVYTSPASFTGGDSFGYIIEDSDGATDTATVSVTVACGPGRITTYTYTYATLESETNDVVDELEAEGAPDSSFAQLYNNNETLVLDMGQVFSAGTQYEITWRRRNDVGSGTAIIDLSESTLPGSGFTNHPVSPQNADNVSFTTTMVTSNVDFGYLSFSKGNSSTVDYEIDAVAVRSATSCEDDYDEDGIADIDDLDDDNDGLSDETECEVVIAEGGFEGYSGLSLGNNLNENISPWQTASPTNIIRVDGAGGFNYGNGGPEFDARGGAGNYYDINGSGNIYQSFTIGQTTTIKYQGYFSARDGDTGTGEIRIYSGGSGTAGTQISTTGVTTTADNNNWTFTSNTVTLNAGTYSYVVIMSNPINFDEGTVLNLCNEDADGDGIKNSNDLDSDNDGIADVVEGGGTDINGDGVVDVFEDNDEDGLADEYDNDQGGSAPNDPDTDGDALEDRLDIDSDNDGIPDNTEAQSTAAFVSRSGEDLDQDGIDDAYDVNFGNEPIVINNFEGTGNPDYRDTDTDDDTFFDWYEGFDDNGSGDALDDLRDRADAFEAAAGNPLYYVNSDDADSDGIPDWLEDDDSDGRPNFLEVGSAYYFDTDLDGLIDLFDTDNFGVASSTPDLDNDGNPDFRDVDDQISLPVTLLYFTAEPTAMRVRLRWKTYSEVNNDYFTLEHSTDGYEYEFLQQVDGAGNSSTIRSYVTYHLQPRMGANYYRLSQTDFDGKTEILPLAMVYFDQQNTRRAFIFPNPGNGEELYLELTDPTAGTYELVLLDSKGTPILQRKFNVLAAEGLFRKQLLSGNQLTPGLYLLKLTSPEEVVTFKYLVD
jgi:hypothetical protein